MRSFQDTIIVSEEHLREYELKAVESRSGTQARAGWWKAREWQMSGGRRVWGKINRWKKVFYYKSDVFQDMGLKEDAFRRRLTTSASELFTEQRNEEVSRLSRSRSARNSWEFGARTSRTRRDSDDDNRPS
ncbi:hypothetical protein EVAR_83434_1 [Eumeta japonica]|uniref:Uncharacterized protein n=1 Tax=Eumeta variegata TaxID=151549 RepID=A0A4C1TYH7_EUMVA|nr:hypothetical protein EVAR_83434_1 [Eumeta japonica]